MHDDIIYPAIDENIPGWPTHYDLTLLGWLASQVPENGHIIEFGSWCGRSSFPLIKNRKSTVSVALVDSFEYQRPYTKSDLLQNPGKMLGDPDIIRKMNDLADQNLSWKPCLEQCIGSNTGVEIFDIKSDDFVVTKIPNLVFIDGQHDNNAPYRDIQKFINHNQCMIVLDDWRPEFPDVVNASINSKVYASKPRAIFSPPFGRLAIIMPVEGEMLEAGIKLMKRCCLARGGTKSFRQIVAKHG